MIDITENKIESIQKKDLFIESFQMADIGHWHWDFVTEKLFWSKEVKEIFEVSKDFQADLETAINFYEEGEHRDNIDNLVTKATEKPYKIDAKIITAKGNIKWVRTYGNTKRKNGKATILFGSIQDITEIKEHEQELEKLSRIARETQNVVIITDENDIITWVNKAFERVTGYTLDEAIGKNPGNLLQGPETDSKTVAQLSKKIDSKVSFTERILNYSKDGTPYWNQMNVTPIKNSSGEVVEFFSIQEVVTKQVLAQKEIEKQTRRLKEAQEIAKVGDWDFDVKSGKIRWSEAIYLIFERNRNLSPPSFQEIATLYQSDKFTSVVKTALKDRKQYEEDFEIVTYKGNKKYVKTIGIPVTDEHGTVTELRGIVQDITEQVKSYQNNKVLLEEVHHRVKNNLAIISGLLTLEMHEFENDRAKLSFQRSINRIQSMAKVHELLYDTDDHSSIRVDKYLRELSKIIFSTFNLSEAIEIKIDAKEIELNINDAIPLGMLMNELLTNSTKYAFKAGKGIIKIQIKQIGSKYFVQYKDSGSGMTEKPNLANSKTLGFTIINTLLDQLGAEYELDVDEKFEITLNFERTSKGSHSNL
jgi:PAS domain S-box-containing protein